MILEDWEKVTKLLNANGRKLTTAQVIKAYKTEYTGDYHRPYADELEELAKKRDIEGLARQMEQVQWSSYVD